MIERPRWEEFAALVADERSLPDGCISPTTDAAWQAVLDLIARRHWQAIYTMDDLEVQPPDVATALFGQFGTLKVWPSPRLQLNFFPYESSSIDFDFDTAELHSQADLDRLCDVLQDLGQAVSLPVVITYEGSTVPLITYHPAPPRFLLHG